MQVVSGDFLVPWIEDMCYQNKEDMYSKHINMKRLFPTCPMCEAQTTNVEGWNNLDGKNPMFRHPTDIVCLVCNHRFCTDCKLSHHGKLCNGIDSPDNCKINTMLMSEKRQKLVCNNCQTYHLWVTQNLIFLYKPKQVSIFLKYQFF